MESGLPGRCGEKFKVLQLLREGGYGRIFLAQQEDLDRPVVVKILSPASLKEAEDVQRFLNEARITTRLSHPNIVVVIDHDVEDGIPWIAYEYLPGRNLRDALVRGAISLDGALDVGVQVAAALEEAHSKEVLHRDIKPENVVEVEPGRYKVIDFGIAKWSGDHAVHTMSGYIMGTPNYMSPELIQGKPRGGPAAVPGRHAAGRDGKAPERGASDAVGAPARGAACARRGDPEGARQEACRALPARRGDESVPGAHEDGDLPPAPASPAPADPASGRDRGPAHGHPARPALPARG
ncbi:MAG: serine/threonine protein kinase [Candidatus Riflebacteria bacterium]|nr:serine/threonine protein kinase [Candidatus Riflebacteria bacterium]